MIWGATFDDQRDISSSKLEEIKIYCEVVHLSCFLLCRNMECRRISLML